MSVSYLDLGLKRSAQVALDLARSSAPGIAPVGRSPLSQKADPPNGQPNAAWPPAAPAAAMPGKDAGAKPVQLPPRKPKHGRTVSFGAVNGERRENAEARAQAAGDVESGWPTQPRAQAGEPLQAPRQARAATYTRAVTSCGGRAKLQQGLLLYSHGMCSVCCI